MRGEVGGGGAFAPNAPSWIRHWTEGATVTSGGAVPPHFFQYLVAKVKQLF